MDIQYSDTIKNEVMLPNKVVNDIKGLKKKYEPPIDLQMTSSLISATSSLTSPVDSGVQLLDSESDMLSVMSMSGTGCDIDSNLLSDTKEIEQNSATQMYDVNKLKQEIIGNNVILTNVQENIMTKSDIANQNVTPCTTYLVYSSSAPNIDYKNIEANQVINTESEKYEEKQDIDKTIADSSDVLGTDLHVSVSEEVKEEIQDKVLNQIENSENQVVNSQPDEQIVFRRQRKKKSSKSDTPKKRVSFHEDILNSTRIDDIHINHGFITHQPDISMSFFPWDSLKKKDVIKGRYSWAAEGDTPYYESNVPERGTQSELYVTRNFSSSSSSTNSFDSGSSNSLCDNDSSSGTPPQNSDLTKPKLPKSSCLKKRPKTTYIETHIVEENIGLTSPRQRKSESNLLDTNIFGSLKNIFSTSVPLAERGVPEGSEDVNMHLSSQSLSSSSKQQAFGKRDSWVCKSQDRDEKMTELPKKVNNILIEPPKNILKLIPNEDFYSGALPTNVPENAIVCDSAVYEHRGISYSYEYDKFQKSFEQDVTNPKPKSSTVYQILLQELNFFKKKEKEISENNLQSLCQTSTPIKENPSQKSTNSQSDWSSETTETISDMFDVPSKHLASPKHKVKPNHFSVQTLKASESNEKNEDTSFKIPKSQSSKTSLINRFLKNVTMKKLLDTKLQKKRKSRINNGMTLYIKGAKPNEKLSNDLDLEIQEEFLRNKKKIIPVEMKVGSSFIIRVKKEIFNDPTEKLCNLFKVRSIYTSTGETRPLIIFLSNLTLYITGFKQNHSFVNHFILPYVELDTILVGPGSHIIYFSNALNSLRKQQYMVMTGSSQITAEIIGKLEMIMRTSIIKYKLPAVRQLTMRDMMCLRNNICKQTAVEKDEEYFQYSIVNVQEINCDVTITPLGPVKEGPLMFKMTPESRWETGYFILKGGVLYMLSSPSNRLPMQALPLSGGACLGAHRTPMSKRPHTFELLLTNGALQLAAPDEYVASDWLQLLVQAASGLYSSDYNNTQSCTLLLTSNHLLTIRESFPVLRFNQHSNITQMLTCATISDIMSVRIPLAEQSWCILEFACREVLETSGDLVIYFATNAELEKFLSNLEILWSYNNTEGDSFPLHTISENESISKRCVDAYCSLQTAWSAIGINLE